MATIEERAKKCSNEWRHYKDFYKIEYIIEKALVEQDRIARQEEREIDIEKAQKVHCDICGCRIPCKVCPDKDLIRKTMERGE